MLLPHVTSQSFLTSCETSQVEGKCQGKCKLGWVINQEKPEAAAGTGGVLGDAKPASAA